MNGLLIFVAPSSPPHCSSYCHFLHQGIASPGTVSQAWQYHYALSLFDAGAGQSSHGPSGMGDQERIRSSYWILENSPDQDPTGSCFDHGESKGILYFSPDPGSQPDPTGSLFDHSVGRPRLSPPKSRYATQTEGISYIIT